MGRLFGGLFLLIGLVGICFSASGVLIGWYLLDEATATLEKEFSLSLQLLDTLQKNVVFTKNSLEKTSDGLTMVEKTATDVGITIEETVPLIDQVNQIATTDIPQTLDTVQDTIPEIGDMVITVDETLYKLSQLTVDESILGFRLIFDLGIDYEPTSTLVDSINEVGVTLNHLSTDFRGLQADFTTTRENLHLLGQDTLQLSQEVNLLQEQVTTLLPLFDDYLQIINSAQTDIRRMQTGLRSRVAIIKVVMVMMMGWFGFSQLVPLYLGWRMILGRSSDPILKTI